VIASWNLSSRNWLEAFLKERIKVFGCEKSEANGQATVCLVKFGWCVLLTFWLPIASPESNAHPYLAKSPSF
jgi:hypothetical protein